MKQVWKCVARRNSKHPPIACRWLRATTSGLAWDGRVWQNSEVTVVSIGELRMGHSTYVRTGVIAFTCSSSLRCRESRFTRKGNSYISLWLEVSSPWYAPRRCPIVESRCLDQSTSTGYDSTCRNRHARTGRRNMHPRRPMTTCVSAPGKQSETKYSRKKPSPLSPPRMNSSGYAWVGSMERALPRPAVGIPSDSWWRRGGSPNICGWRWGCGIVLELCGVISLNPLFGLL